MDRWIGKKIKDGDELLVALRKFRDHHGKDERILRIFSTASEFFNAKELRTINEMRCNRNFVISSWMVLESDIHYSLSMGLYQQIYQSLYRDGIEPLIVSTGNKSIHIIFEFDYRRYLSPPEAKLIKSTTLDLPKRVWLENDARQKFVDWFLFENYKLTQWIDKRVAFDFMRQIPIAGTLNQNNNQKNGWVTPLDRNYLFCHHNYISRKIQIHPDDTKAHQELDNEVAELVKENIYDLQVKFGIS